MHNKSQGHAYFFVYVELRSGPIVRLPVVSSDTSRVENRVRHQSVIESAHPTRMGVLGRIENWWRALAGDKMLSLPPPVKDVSPPVEVPVETITSSARIHVGAAWREIDEPLPKPKKKKAKKKKRK